MEHKEMQVTNPQQDGRIYTEQPDKEKYLLKRNLDFTVVPGI